MTVSLITGRGELTFIGHMLCAGGLCWLLEVLRDHGVNHLPYCCEQRG